MRPGRSCGRISFFRFLEPCPHKGAHACVPTPLRTGSSGRLLARSGLDEKVWPDSWDHSARSSPAAAVLPFPELGQVWGVLNK